MGWKHRRDRTKAEAKKTEPKAGADETFLAAMVIAA